MPNLFFHGGPSKTGTSYLQVLFARYSERLNEAGIVYPRGDGLEAAAAGQITIGNGAAVAKYIWPDRWHYIPDRPNFIDEFDAQLASAAGKHILYSTEFFHFKPGKQIETLLKIAKLHGYDVRVIYMVRDIDEAAFSAYSQYVKVLGEKKPFYGFIQDWPLEYQDRLQDAITCFGRDSVLVYNYDEHRSRLAELFFRDILNAGFVPEERSIINRSISLAEAEMLRLLNVAYQSDVTAFVANVLMEIDVSPAPFRVTKDEVRLLQRRFGHEVDYVNGLVRGHPIAIAKQEVDQRPIPNLSDYERVQLSIMAKLASTISETRSDVARCESGISQLRSDLTQSVEGISEQYSDRMRLAAELQAMQNSTSWRVTAPLRWLRSRFARHSKQPF